MLRGIYQKSPGMLLNALFHQLTTLNLRQCPKTDQEKDKMSNVLYVSAVGSLMYAMLCTRHDICFAVGLVSHYQSNPGPTH